MVRIITATLGSFLVLPVMAADLPQPSVGYIATYRQGSRVLTVHHRNGFMRIDEEAPIRQERRAAPQRSTSYIDLRARTVVFVPAPPTAGPRPLLGIRFILRSDEAVFPPFGQGERQGPGQMAGMSCDLWAIEAPQALLACYTPDGILLGTGGGQPPIELTALNRTLPDENLLHPPADLAIRDGSLR